MDNSMPWQRRSPPQDAALVEGLVGSTSRITAVEGSGLLDSFAEESFDSLTRLAARLVKVPVSFISIVAADRDFYKSQTGFPAPLCDDRELSGRTFCHFALGSDTPLVIDDTHSNELWKSVPTVETLGVRAYVGVPIKVDGEIIGSFCVIDVKPREWQPEELETVRQIAISAGREITLRSAAASALREAATYLSLARAREEVVAVVAHDLRTPLQVLRLAAQVLRKGADGGSAATLDRMFRSIDAMKQMADSLLSAGALLAPSATGKKTVSGKVLLGEAVDMMQPIAERSGISLSLAQGSDALIHVDAAQMLRVLGNLIGNSIKYSSAGGAVCVRGKCEAGQFLIAVEDHGQGMSAADQARAFDSGWQGAEGMVRGDGAGLGLAIARTLVREHGGAISLRSDVGAGTTVTISLLAVPAPLALATA